MTSFIRNAANRLKTCSKYLYRGLRTQIEPPKTVVPIVSKVLSAQWIYKQENTIKLPVNFKVQPISMPNSLWWVPVIDEPTLPQVIEAPTLNTHTEKRAARLIVIRRKKMKKHKLRKLRKKMKFEWAKRRQKRELRKEKAFQAGLIAQCKKAESFSAEEYVEERLRKLNEVPLPTRWKGRRLPEFIIREKLGLPPK